MSNNGRSRCGECWPSIAGVLGGEEEWRSLEGAVFHVYIMLCPGLLKTSSVMRRLSIDYNAPKAVLLNNIVKVSCKKASRY